MKRLCEETLRIARFVNFVFSSACRPDPNRAGGGGGAGAGTASMRSGRLVINGSGRPGARQDQNPDPNLVNVYRKMDDTGGAEGDDHKINSAAVVVVEQLPPPPKAFNVPVVDVSKYDNDDKETAFR